MERGRKVKGGAATHISRDGNLKLVFKLDKSWLVSRPLFPLQAIDCKLRWYQEDRANHTPFDPDHNDLKISINIEADGVKSVYTIDRQTWPTTFTHNGVEHMFDETSSIRLAAIKTDEVALDLRDRPYGYPEPSPWRARELIGDLDVAEDDAGRSGFRAGRCPSPSPERIHPGILKRRHVTQRLTSSTQELKARNGRYDSALQSPARHIRKRIEDTDDDETEYQPLPSLSEILDRELGRISKDKAPGSEHRPFDDNNEIVTQSASSQSSIATIKRTTVVPESSERRRVMVRTTDGMEINFMVKASTRTMKVYEAVSKRQAIDVKILALFYDGMRLSQLGTMEDNVIWDSTPYGDEEPSIHMEAILEQRGGKPVIYLYPPEPMPVTVNLSLCPQCKF
jgi:hypothetical protein